MRDATCSLKPVRFRRVMAEIWRGKTLLRSLQNSMLDGLPVEGRVVDLGAKSSAASYHRVFDTRNATVTFCDIAPADASVIRVDLERPLPFADAEFDWVLLIWVIYIIRERDQLFREMRRICRGRVLLITPFLTYAPPEPHNWGHMSAEGVADRLAAAGFTQIEATPIAVGPLLCAVNVLDRHIRSRTVRSAVIALTWAMEAVLRRVSRGYRLQSHELAAIAIAS